MELNERTIIEQQLKGINLRVLWGLVLCTAVSVSTVLSVYYGLREDNEAVKNDNKIMSLRIDIAQKQIDALDKRIEKIEGSD